MFPTKQLPLLDNLDYEEYQTKGEKDDDDYLQHNCFTTTQLKRSSVHDTRRIFKLDNELLVTSTLIINVKLHLHMI